MSQSVLRLIYLCRSRALAGCRGLDDDAGSALVELAFTLSIVGVPLLLGTICTAQLLYDSIEISNAAHAGAMYGMTSSTLAHDSTSITAAARAEASDINTNLTVTPTVYYACSSALGGTQYSLQADADAACNGGSSHTLQFIRVVTSAAITPMGKVPGLPKTVTLTSTSVMEVQE